MSTIIALHNGHSKVVRGRFGGESGYSRSQERREYSWKRDILSRIQDNEDRTELSDCLEMLEQEGSCGVHPHDIGLPDLTMVRERLEEGDRRNGLTTVLNGALGVSQWGRNRIEMPMNIGSRRGKRRGKGSKKLEKVVLLLDDNGRIISAHCQ